MAKILLVEDDDMISEICQKKFEESGFELILATTGKEALSILKKDKFDLVLLDLIIPEMDGMDVLLEIKKSGKYDPATKVVIFSNLNEIEQQNKAAENGADGFIYKGNFKPTELVTEINRYLNEFKEQGKNEIVQSAPKENNNTDTQKRILFIEDEEVFLDMFGKKLENDGYTVELARNGAWGFKETQTKKFDLIILDMVMPAMNGKEIIEKLKMEEKTKNIPIIVLSASARDKDVEEVKKMGINGCFVKTQIVPSDLSRKVKEILK